MRIYQKDREYLTEDQKVVRAEGPVGSLELKLDGFVCSAVIEEDDRFLLNGSMYDAYCTREQTREHIAGRGNVTRVKIEFYRLPELHERKSA